MIMQWRPMAAASEKLMMFDIFYVFAKIMIIYIKELKYLNSKSIQIALTFILFQMIVAYVFTIFAQ